jgi:hypothetical protein
MRNILLSVFLSGGTLLLNAQNSTDSIPDPEYMNQVFAWGKDHKLMSLEKKDAEIVTKNKSGIGGAKQMYEMDGGTSSVIITPENIMFVVSTSGGGFGMDPSSQFALIKFETKKNKRQAISAEYGGIMKKGKQQQGANEIDLNFKKIREGIIGLVPGKPLEKGEYAFLNKMSMQGGGMSMKMEAFAFSIQ